MNSRQSIGSTEQYNDELQEAGVTPLQWNGICKLARLEQDDASIEKVKKKNFLPSSSSQKNKKFKKMTKHLLFNIPFSFLLIFCIQKIQQQSTNINT